MFWATRVPHWYFQRVHGWVYVEVWPINGLWQVDVFRPCWNLWGSFEFVLWVIFWCDGAGPESCKPRLRISMSGVCNSVFWLIPRVAPRTSRNLWVLAEGLYPKGRRTLPENCLSDLGIGVCNSSIEPSCSCFPLKSLWIADARHLSTIARTQKVVDYVRWGRLRGHSDSGLWSIIVI